MDANWENHIRSHITIALNSTQRIKVEFRPDTNKEEFAGISEMMNNEEIAIDTEGLERIRFASRNGFWGPNREVYISFQRRFDIKKFLKLVGRAVETIETAENPPTLH